MLTACVALPMHILAVFGAAAPPAGADLDPLVASASRWTVAIQVDREEESARRPPRGGGKASARIPQDVLDYFRRPSGPATGVILDGTANILTTFYNVSGRLKGIEVVLPDGRKVPAKLVAADRADDLALLRTEAPTGLEVPPVPWADSSKLRVGRMVLALGRSPDPAMPTATLGIISAVGRNSCRAFQTDAKLNYGNVGGPIIGLDGSFVGIAAFVGHTYPMWGLNSGIGFGTHADTIRTVLPDLIAGRSPELPVLGVRPADGVAGAILGFIAPDSGAAAAGVKAGDRVLAIDGTPVQDFVELMWIINHRRAGDEVTLKILREEKTLELKARLGKRPE